MYRKEKSSWKPPFGLTVFVVVATLTALISVFALLRIGENYITWGETELDVIGHYNYLPIIIAFLSCFLPLLAIPIGKKMRDHQRLLAFTLFLVTVMIFYMSQGFKISTESSEIRYRWGDSFLPTITLYSFKETWEAFYLFEILQVVLKYLLCFLPLLAFPIANVIHKKNQCSKTTSLLILLFVLLCWTVNLYLLCFRGDILCWGSLYVFHFGKISFGDGMFFFVGIAFLSSLPLHGLNARKSSTIIEKHYIEKRIIYCPIERNDRD